MDNYFNYSNLVNLTQNENEESKAEDAAPLAAFHQHKAEDTSSHILVNAVLHQPIKNAINYVKTQFEDRVTQELRSLKGAAQNKLKGLQKKLKNASEDEKADIQDEITTAKANVRTTASNLRQKLAGPKEDTEPVEPQFTTKTIKGSPEETDVIDKPHPARDQPDESYEDMPEDDLDDALQGNLEKSLARVITRGNNLDGEAQQRAIDSYRTNPDRIVDDDAVDQEPTNFTDVLSNLKLKEQAIKTEEQNPETTFRDPEQQLEADQDVRNPDNDFGRPDAQEDVQSTYDNPAETETIVTKPAVPDRTIQEPVEPVEEPTLIPPKSLAEQAEQKVKSKLKQDVEEDADTAEVAPELDPFLILGQLIIGGATILPGLLKRAPKPSYIAPLNPSTQFGESDV
jgi:hypothetical protein